MAAWNAIKVEQLISLLEEHPCLYNTKDDSYHDREKRGKAISEISKSLDISDTSEVTKKIRNIRTQYSRERQKYKKRPTGTGTDEVYKPKWVHFYQLQFLDDYITPKKTISNLESHDFEDEDYDSAEELFEDLKEEQPKAKTETPKKTKKRKREEKEDLLLERAISSLEKGPVTGTKETTDSDEAFAQFVASELRQVTDLKVKKVIKWKITNVIFEASMTTAPGSSTWIQPGLPQASMPYSSTCPTDAYAAFMGQSTTTKTL